MESRLSFDGTRLSSIWQINGLPEDAKHALYCSLIPPTVLQDACTAIATDRQEGDPISVSIRCPTETGFVEIDVRHAHDPRDPLLYVQIADTPSGQIQVLLMCVNDPSGERFDIDRDWEGETKLGTMRRNVDAEIEAFRAGLAPGQVRRGLGLSRSLIGVMETFAAGLAKDRFFIEPLAYHNAITFERYGFAYMTGKAGMVEIHQGFQPGGALWQQLDGSTPFRERGAEKTVRGRSWAIHDGILGQPWTGVRMYKRIGHDAGMCTFPDAVY